MVPFFISKRIVWVMVGSNAGADSTDRIADILVHSKCRDQVSDVAFRSPFSLGPGERYSSQIGNILSNGT